MDVAPALARDLVRCGCSLGLTNELVCCGHGLGFGRGLDDKLVRPEEEFASPEELGPEADAAWPEEAGPKAEVARPQLVGHSVSSDLVRRGRGAASASAPGACLP